MGRYVSTALVGKGYRVRALVMNKEQVLTLPAGIVPYIGDITNPRAMAKACDGADAVVHLAAVVSEYKYSTEQILNTNVIGTRTVIDACKDNGVRKILFPSTSDVYGRSRSERLTEDSELKPSDKYGYSKMLAEDVLREESGTLAYTIFRLAVVYGPGFEHSFFKLLRLINQGKAYLVGSGDNHLAVVHVTDIVQAFVLSLEKPASDKRVYNISDGEDHTQRQLYDLAAEYLKVPKPTKQISNIVMNVMAKTRGIDSDEMRFLTSNRLLDITRARKELGYRPKVSIRMGAQELVKEFVEKQRYSTMRSVI